MAAHARAGRGAPQLVGPHGRLLPLALADRAPPAARRRGARTRAAGPRRAPGTAPRVHAAPARAHRDGRPHLGPHRRARPGARAGAPAAAGASDRTAAPLPAAGCGAAGQAQVPARRRLARGIGRRLGGIPRAARLPARRPAAARALEELRAHRQAGGEGIPGRVLRAPRAGAGHRQHQGRGRRLRGCGRARRFVRLHHRHARMPARPAVRGRRRGHRATRRQGLHRRPRPDAVGAHAGSARGGRAQRQHGVSLARARGGGAPRQPVQRDPDPARLG